MSANTNPHDVDAAGADAVSYTIHTATTAKPLWTPA
jgi:hypothetical protein